MQLDFSFFLSAVIPTVGAILGIIWWVRRLWSQKYEKRADIQDAKLDEMKAKLNFIISSQRNTDVIMWQMCACLDDLRVEQGKSRKFTPAQILPILEPVNDFERQRAELLHDVQEMLYRVIKLINASKGK